jgi:hypothetical protein
MALHSTRDQILVTTSPLRTPVFDMIVWMSEPAP